MKDLLSHIEALEERLRKAGEALKESNAEIEYWHADMLTEDERNHPRGSGWARVYDKNKEALAELSPISE